jgi:molecular chaperone GrpE
MRQEETGLNREDDLTTGGDGAMTLDGLSRDLAEARARAEENLANWQRAQADFINFKRRLEMDRDEALKFGQFNLLQELLPVLDDFARAGNAIPCAYADQPWVEGVNSIQRKLSAILSSRGVKEIKALGEPFDPSKHEAIMQTPGPEGMVIQELQKGYMFQDRILRASQVAVGNGQKES